MCSLCACVSTTHSICNQGDSPFCSPRSSTLFHLLLLPHSPSLPPPSPARVAILTSLTDCSTASLLPGSQPATPTWLTSRNSSQNSSTCQSSWRTQTTSTSVSLQRDSLEIQHMHTSAIVHTCTVCICTGTCTCLYMYMVHTLPVHAHVYNVLLSILYMYVYFGTAYICSAVLPQIV